jgi:hypothetical protein
VEEEVSDPATAGFRVVTERWRSERHFWSCTFCAAVMSRRWEAWGVSNCPPGNEAEVRALASVSGDPDLAHGSVTSEMLTAVRRRYHRNWEKNPQTKDEFTRYMTQLGTAANIAVNAGAMPSQVRAFYGSFTGMHRTFVVATRRKNSRRQWVVRVYDPLMPQGHEGVDASIDGIWHALHPAETVIVHAPR